MMAGNVSKMTVLAHKRAHYLVSVFTGAAAVLQASLLLLGCCKNISRRVKLPLSRHKNKHLILLLLCRHSVWKVFIELRFSVWDISFWHPNTLKDSQFKATDLAKLLRNVVILSSVICWLSAQDCGSMFYSAFDSTCSYVGQMLVWYMLLLHDSYGVAKAKDSGSFLHQKYYSYAFYSSV